MCERCLGAWQGLFLGLGKAGAKALARSYRSMNTSLGIIRVWVYATGDFSPLHATWYLDLPYLSQFSIGSFDITGRGRFTDTQHFVKILLGAGQGQQQHNHKYRTGHHS